MSRILIVDDSAFVRRLMEASLRPLGIAIELAENGLDALERARATAFSLVITDLNMPKMTGLQLLGEVRNGTASAACSAFVVTASPTPELLAEGRRVGVTAWILKPVNPVHIRLAASRVHGLALSDHHASGPPSEEPGTAPVAAVPAAGEGGQVGKDGAPRGSRSAIMVVSREDALARAVHTCAGEWVVDVAPDGDEARQRLAGGAFGVVVVDLRESIRAGAALLRWVRSVLPAAACVAIAARGALPGALQVVNREGVFRLLAEPVLSESLTQALAEAADQYRVLSSDRDMMGERLRTTVQGLLAIERTLLLDAVALTLGEAVQRAHPVLMRSHHALLRCRETGTPPPGEVLMALADVGRTLEPHADAYGASGRCARPAARGWADLCAVVCDVVQTIRCWGAWRTAVIHLEVPLSSIPVAIARADLEHVVYQLLKNALEAMPGPQAVHVVVAVGTEPEAAGGWLRVSDNGRGVPDAIAARMFEPYVSGKEGALGLGLSTARGLVERAGGQLQQATADGRGTTMTVLLPPA